MSPKPATVLVDEFHRNGAVWMPQALPEHVLEEVEAILRDLPPDRAGVRLQGLIGLRSLLSTKGVGGGAAARVLGPAAQPVRAILFDKTEHTNWSLAWHQDRTVAVKTRVDIEGFGPWTRKDGMLHVAPPFDVLADMVTLRIHLDPVPRTNAPLLIAPGSHRLGRIPEPDIPEVVRRHGTVTCLAQRGDIWLYATPILHASEAAREPRRRRVLQVDYAARELPGGLEWLGV